MDVRGVLAGAALFSAASAAELDQLAAMAASRRVARGGLLFAEGEQAEQLHVVAAGRVKVLVASPRGEQLVLTVLGPGDALGELSVLDHLPRSATAQALDDVQVVTVPAAELRHLLSRSPRLALSWAQELSGTVRRLTGATGDLVFLDLPRRLAKLLLDDGRQDVDLGMSQSEVASRLGVTRQSLNRALSSLQRRGWIRVEGARIVLEDRSALEHFAGS